MTLLGKIFTVLILIMSVLFMGFSIVVYATHRNWQMLVDNPTATDKYPLGLKQRLETMKETNVNLRTEIDRLNSKLAAEQAARRHALGGLETKLVEGQKRLEEKEAELRARQSAQGEAAAALKTAQLTVEALRKEVEGLRAEIRVAQEDRDMQFDKVVTLTDQLHAAQGVERNLTERTQQLIAEVSAMKRVLDKFDLNPNASYENVAPDLDGIVTAVSQNDFIEVSLGTDDGLKEGHRLEVFRDNSYLGYAIVVRAAPDRAVAQVNEKSKRDLIKVNDRVATKLSRSRTS